MKTVDENGLTREIEWDSAWKSEKGVDGIHGMDLRFLLSGPKGTVQFVIFTNWMLPVFRPGGMEKKEAIFLLPIPADFGYHAYFPQYDGQEAFAESCQYLNGQPCYYDGSGLAAYYLFDEFIAKGEDVVWEALKDRYENLNGDNVDWKALDESE